MEEFETLKASNVSLEEELKKTKAQLKSLEGLKKQWEEEKQKLSSSVRSLSNTVESEKSQKARYEELLTQKDEEIAAINRSVTDEKKKAFDAGEHIEKEKWTKVLLPELRKKHEEEAIRRFLGSSLFNYLSTTKAFPQVQGAFDRAVAQVKFLGALKEKVDLSTMAVYLGDNLEPLTEDETGEDFSQDEFAFAMEIVQTQVIEEMQRNAEGSSGNGEEEEQNEAISVPGVEAGGVEAPPSVNPDTSKVGEPVSQPPPQEN